MNSVGNCLSVRDAMPNGLPQVDAHRKTDYLGVGDPLILECGQPLDHFRIAYEYYGTLNSKKDNAILICHALTGDQYVASRNPVTGRDGWWSEMVGQGKPIDTDQYFVVCSNILGGCMGTDGPTSIKPNTDQLWGVEFPLVTIGDMVNAQAKLIDFLGISKLFAVVGGSMGGMQVLEWLRRYPDRLRSVVGLATSYRQHVQNIAFHVAGRRAIMNDPEWMGGEYAIHGKFPSNGLALARMIAHVTYLAPDELAKKFGRRLQAKNFKTFDFAVNFQIESYLKHQGSAFTERFDPNSYLYITQAVDFFDQSEAFAGDLAEVYRDGYSRKKLAACLISFTSDWMYPVSESSAIESALRSVGVTVEGHELDARAESVQVASYPAALK